MNAVVLEVTDRQRRLATEWHGGQSSMLYAVASTGALTFGTVRPSWWPGQPMTDDEWGRHLAAKLARELDLVAHEAGSNYAMTDDPEMAADANVAMLWAIEAHARATNDMPGLVQAAVTITGEWAA